MNRLLRATLRSADLFINQNEIDWVTCLVAFAIRTTEQPLRSAAVQALVVAREDQTQFWLDVGPAGGLAQIAIARHDEQLLLDVMPVLLEELEGTEENVARGAWSAWQRERMIALEALVEVCRWRDDANMSVRCQDKTRHLRGTSPRSTDVRAGEFQVRLSADTFSDPG